MLDKEETENLILDIGFTLSEARLPWTPEQLAADICMALFPTAPTIERTMLEVEMLDRIVQVLRGCSSNRAASRRAPLKSARAVRTRNSGRSNGRTWPGGAESWRATLDYFAVLVMDYNLFDA